MTRRRSGRVNDLFVSVVIPAYNPGEYLAPALDSLLSQSIHEWEAFVVDDGSTEDLSWVDALDPRLSLIRTKNRGVSAARNVGIAKSAAEWVAFLDADDVWHPDKLRQQLRFSKGSDAALIDCTFNLIDHRGEVVGHSSDWRNKPARPDYYSLLLGNHTAMSAALVRREMFSRVGLFDPTYHGVADWDMWLRIAMDHPIARVDSELASWRVHPSSMSSNHLMMYRETMSVLERHQLRARRVGDTEVVEVCELTKRNRRRDMREIALQQASVAFRSRDFAETWTHAATALRVSPPPTSGAAAARRVRRAVGLARSRQ